MSFGRYYQGQILTDIKSRTLELALYTSNPTAADTGTEVSGGAYARVSVALGTNQTEADGTFAVNSGVISFPQATADWSSGTPVSHFALRVQGGGLIMYGAISELGVPTSRVVRTGDVWRIPVGALKFKITD